MKLIICEKNQSAKRISEILSRKKAKRESYYKNVYYSFKWDDENVLVMGLRGHILTLEFPPEYENWQKVEPFNLISAETMKVPKSKSLIKLIKEKAKKASEVIVATDFDREGELIGFDVISLIKKVNPEVKIKRARFSTLTSDDINKAFSNLEEPHFSLAMAGETRQEIDLYWGAILTRFISLASKRLWENYLSAGRVQSPTLTILAEREKKIAEFKTTPYWQIRCEISKDKQNFFAFHKKRKFNNREEAEKILNKLSERGIVKSVNQVKRVKKPPSPFNTTSFLQEAAKIGFSPTKAMNVAENLYMGGYISYPRVDNTVYPSSLNLRKVLQRLKKFKKISDLAEELLIKKRLIPTKGSKISSDHPPIYPTRVPDKKVISSDQMRIFELVSRRFISTLANKAIILSVNVKIEISKEIFLANGLQIVDEGWMKFYPYIKTKEIYLPPLKEGDELNVLNSEILDKETKPPARYTQSKLINKMEKLNLGTKSTRHTIIQNLYNRGYIYNNPIITTKTGIVVADVLKNHAEKISSSEMTSDLENDMDRIASGKENKEKVVKKSKQLLNDILIQLSDSKNEIGEKIRTGVYEDKRIAECPKCGKDLIIIKSRKTRKRFVGCSNYPDCSQAYPIPQKGRIFSTGEICKYCNTAIIKIVVKGRKPWNLCLNPDCPSKKDKSIEKYPEQKLKGKTKKELETFGKCPNCKNDLVLRTARKSKKIFLGCSNYPKCKTTFSIPQSGEIKPNEKLCDVCGFPQIEIISEDKTSKILCINRSCSTNK